MRTLETHVTANKASDVLMSKVYTEIKIPLGKVFKNNGLFAPYNLVGHPVEYSITLPKATMIMKAQTNQSVAGYSLEDIHLEYKTIKSVQLAKDITREYENKQLAYDFIELLESPIWASASTKELIRVNIPRKSMKAIILMFKPTGNNGTEDYVYPNIDKVNVSFEGDSTSVFNGGLKKEMMYEEARSYFTGDIKCTEFYKNKFALVIDLRGVDNDNVIGTGRKLTGQVLLEIEKTATLNNLYCHVFVVSDATATITDLRFKERDLEN